jgi:peroxiredoxin
VTLTASSRWRLYKRRCLRYNAWEQTWSQFPQLEKYGRSVRHRLNLSFDILTDRGLQVAAQFGLGFVLPDYLKQVYLRFGNKLDEFHGEDAFRLPMPARYVIDSQSVIRSPNVNADYTVRPEPSETIRVLEQLTNETGIAS